MTDDDIVVPFRAEASGVMGRLVRLGPAVDHILTRHAYPDAVAMVLGEAVALTAMLGAALKFDKADSKFILQTRSDGPIGLIVVNFDSPGHLRAYAAFDEAQLAARGKAAAGPDDGRLIGSGQLAMTIDPGGGMERYQGIVALDGGSIAEAALDYFRQSEQLPTFIRLAVGRVHGGPGDGWHWRAGGLLIQHLTEEGGNRPPAFDRLKGDGTGYEYDEHWERTRILAATVEDHELTDPSLAPDRLLYRLFHEEGVRAFERRPLQARCGCSRERLGGILRSFTAAERRDMAAEDGTVTATCEYCNTSYRFTSAEIG
ncbi:MAG: Hsp33 family molecular chaperone [Hyphomicrobiaceae bacterium]